MGWMGGLGGPIIYHIRQLGSGKGCDLGYPDRISQIAPAMKSQSVCHSCWGALPQPLEANG